MAHNMTRPIWQAERFGFSSRAERIVRDLSHASVLVFALTAVLTGILASISLSSEFGIGATASFIVVAVLFPLLCGWLWKERWRANKLEERLKRQQANFRLMNDATVSGDDTPAGLLIISSDLRVCFVNQTYLRCTLHRPEEVLGRKIQDVLVAESVEDLAKALLGHSYLAASCCFNTCIRARLAGERPVHITMSRIAPQEGKDRVLVIVKNLPQGCPPSDLSG